MRKTAFLICLITLIVALSSMSAWAQWGGRGSAGSFGVSYAYSGDPDGFRVEYTTEDFIVDGLYFNDNARDSKIMGLEVGWKASGGGSALGGNAFVVGAGYYNDDPDVLPDDSGVGFWAGIGDFSTSSGIFYQFRYVFNGPIEGTQGILGWRF